MNISPFYRFPSRINRHASFLTSILPVMPNRWRFWDGQPQRSYMKTLMLTCMNTENDRATIGAFNDKLENVTVFDGITGTVRDEKGYVKHRGINAGDMLRAVKEAYPQMGDYLSSDCGVVMQALEAKMLQQMINNLYYMQWVECWPLHDALYIPLLR